MNAAIYDTYSITPFLHLAQLTAQQILAILTLFYLLVSAFVPLVAWGYPLCCCCQEMYKVYKTN